MRKSVIAALGALIMTSPVAAQELALDEVRAGVFYHSAYGGLLTACNNWHFS